MPSMANIDAPTGLSPVQDTNGRPYTGAARTYYIPSSVNTDIFIGDPVIATGTADADGNPSCTIATAGSGNYITGVVVGFTPAYPYSTTAPNLNLVYGPAATIRYPLVADDPNLLYAVQASGAFAVTDIGSNANITLATAGSTFNGLSGAELDSTSIGTAATKQLRIVGILQAPENAFGTNAKVLVKLNTSSFVNTTGI